MKKFKVMVSETALSQFRILDEKTRRRIKQHLNGLENDPFMRRSGADIRKLRGSRDPELYRLRVGDYRAIYAIIGIEVKVVEIIHRSRGYEWLD